MLEELNYQEMSEILGGSMSYCDRLQAWANTYFQDERVSDEDWNDWADRWERHCSN